MILERLLGSMSKEDFFGDFWEKKPLHMADQDSARFASLFSLQDLDSMLASLPRNTRISLLKNDLSRPDKPGTKATVGTVIGEVYSKFSEGHTIIVNSMHQHWAPVRDLCCSLASELGFKVQANLYVTPKGTTGFSPHWDDHDVMVLQVSGKKEWRVYGNGPHLPRQTQDNILASMQQRKLCPGDPVMTPTMQPGNLLYLPRGWVHNATATDTPSVHLTVGIRPFSWEQLLIAAIEDYSKTNPEMRKSIPVATLGSSAGPTEAMVSKCSALLRSARDGLDVGGALRILGQTLVNSIEALPSGHFTRIDSFDDIHLETEVCRRTDGMVQLVEEPDYVALVWPGFFQQGPEKMVLAFDYISKTHRFKIGDIPGWYSGREKIVTVRHLLKKGLLTIVDD